MIATKDDYIKAYVAHTLILLLHMVDSEKEELLQTHVHKSLRFLE